MREFSSDRQWDDAAFSRRRLLEVAVWSASSVIVTTVGVTGSRFWIGDSLRAQPQQWIKLGNAADMPPGHMHQTVFQVRSKDAWREVNRSGVLYAYSDDGEEYVVLSATCTHLGCNVRWKADPGHFSCPCHDAFFTRDGNVISGPASRPLQRLEAKIEDGILMVKV
jgi:Rieske Fe-S protein